MKLPGRLGNLTIVIASIIVFVVLMLWGSAQRPPTVTVAVVARDLVIGDTLDASSMTTKTVFKDENSDLYLSAEELQGVYSAVVTLPFRKGQPIYRTAA